MKKILTLILICFAFLAQSQNTIQTAFIHNEYNDTIRIGYFVGSDVETMYYKNIAKTDLSEYNDFVDYCNNISGLTLDNFICQFTKEQTYSNTVTQRIWVIEGEETFPINNPTDIDYINFKNELISKL